VRLAAISVDLDEVDCYTAIHGLPAPVSAAAHAIYRKALPRFEELFGQMDIRATFFAVGRDLADGGVAESIRRLHGAGHEIGNHTANHLYDLTRRDPDTVRREIEEGAAAIARLAGGPPVGFRAPGYTMTEGVLDLLTEQGYLYDSSVFPCPAYYSAKALARAAIRIAGRRSASILDTPLVLTAPGDPYRTGRPFWRRGDGILEMPIGVTGWGTLRFPYLGTTVVLYGKYASRILTRLMLGRPLVNLELHGIELAEADQDGLDFLRPHRPDLRRGLDERKQALSVGIETLRKAGYTFVTLRQAAEALSEEIWRDGR
jgi:peptidoglycan/xylan/chitin deacetylase (PgdA/CDA1 family)